MKWFYTLCVAYAFFYLAASAAVRIGLIDTGGVARAIVTADDAGRGNRLHSASLLLLYGTGYSIASLRARFSVGVLLLTGLFTLCWIATESRSITLLVLLTMLGYALIRNAARLGRMTFIVFAAGLAFSLMLIIDPDLNPFLYFGDQSASVRTNSIDIVSQSIQYYWLTGAGISFGVENYKPLTGITYFFPGDIGLIGIFYTYGVLGLLLYSWLCYLGCMSYRMVCDAIGDYTIATAVALTCIVYALYSLQSPQYNGGSSGSVFAMMLIALVLHLRRERSFRKRR
ncbi:O-antigen ligase family protein [Blastomonas aquatica]|uniref:O-antigen ligase family protein n=2 Tax=Blastomonas aquatica TaxID=1510276 RepID=UPI00361A90FE